MPRKLHLFLSCDGNLYDTRVPEWTTHPLRTNFWGTKHHIQTAADLKATLRAGKHADGGYPLYFHLADGEALSFDAAMSALKLCLASFSVREGDARGGWRIVGCDINYEDTDLFCAHTNERIPSAYGDD